MAKLYSAIGWVNAANPDYISIETFIKNIMAKTSVTRPSEQSVRVKKALVGVTATQISRALGIYAVGILREFDKLNNITRPNSNYIVAQCWRSNTGQKSGRWNDLPHHLIFPPHEKDAAILAAITMYQNGRDSMMQSIAASGGLLLNTGQLVQSGPVLGWHNVASANAVASAFSILVRNTGKKWP